MTAPPPATIADLIAAVALITFALLTWPPAALLITAAAAVAYSWEHR